MLGLTIDTVIEPVVVGVVNLDTQQTLAEHVWEGNANTPGTWPLKSRQCLPKLVSHLANFL